MPYPPFPDTPVRQPPERFMVHRAMGVNRQPGIARSAIRDDDFYWLENLMPMGPGNLRGLYAESFLPYYTAPAGRTIINVFGCVINGVQLQIVFLDNGQADQVNPNNGQVINIDAHLPGLFTDGSGLPVAAQWNNAGIVIIANKSIFPGAGFFAWDGLTLYSGIATPAPAWLTGGAGGFTMPVGISGNAVEVYQNRLWIVTPPSPTVGAILTVSAPNNAADYNTADGAVIVPIQDSSTRVQVNALRQSNGFLYLIGDSNTAAISNVFTGGVPITTTFSNQNLDPQTGTAWQNTCQLYGNALIYAHTSGVYALSGGVVQKISQDIDGLFLNADFSVAPTAAVVTIFGVKCYCIMLRTTDYLGTVRNVICCWNGRKWFLASTNNATVSQIYGFGEEFNSSLLGYCSDGTRLNSLFTRPTNSSNKILQSKLFAGGQQDEEYIVYKKQYRFYFQAFDYGGVGVNLTGEMDNEGGVSPTFSITAPAPFYQFINNTNGVIKFQGIGGTILWGVAGLGITGTDMANYGRLLGCTFDVISADFTITSLMIEYAPDAPFLG